MGTFSKKVDKIRGSNGRLPDYAWPGGYPIVYYDDSQGGLDPICPDCANDDDWTGKHIAEYDVNWEDDALFCENCNKKIECAYCDDADADDDADPDKDLCLLPDHNGKPCHLPRHHVGRHDGHLSGLGRLWDFR